MEGSKTLRVQYGRDAISTALRDELLHFGTLLSSNKLKIGNYLTDIVTTGNSVYLIDDLVDRLGVVVHSLNDNRYRMKTGATCTTHTQYSQIENTEINYRQISNMLDGYASNIYKAMNNFRWVEEEQAKNNADSNWHNAEKTRWIDIKFAADLILPEMMTTLIPNTSVSRTAKLFAIITPSIVTFTKDRDSQLVGGVFKHI